LLLLLGIAAPVNHGRKAIAVVRSINPVPNRIATMDLFLLLRDNP